MEKRQDSLIFKDVSLVAEQGVLLEPINVSVPVGSALVIVGKSGSGKSLLSKAIINQLPDSVQLKGDILYKGQSIVSLSKKEQRAYRGKVFAYMVQNPMAMFNPMQTIETHFYETIRSHHKYNKKECYQLALDALAKMRLPHQQELLTKYPFELSGGMLQRVMLAILMCLDSEVFILDEPTSALDAYNRTNIIKTVQELIQMGKTVVCVTHDYDLAKSVGGQLLVLKDGKVIEFGDSAQVLDNPKATYTRELLLREPYERLVKDHA